MLNKLYLYIFKVDYNLFLFYLQLHCTCTLYIADQREIGCVCTKFYKKRVLIYYVNDKSIKCFTLKEAQVLFKTLFACKPKTVLIYIFITQNNSYLINKVSFLDDYMK